MKHITRSLTDRLSSRLFWYIILGFFTAQALWFVLSAVYPMPFDEDFHMGVIRIYSEQWSPFLNGQPLNADQFGAIARDPSYFFHYLMSFPYRLITLVTSNEAAHVIFLRLINVGLFMYSLVLFRKLLLRAKTSLALTHVILALFTLIPIVPQLAAHVNYDNLLMVLLPLLCLVVLNLVESFQQKRVDVSALFGFITISLYMSVVKYAALPFLIAATASVLVAAAIHFRRIPSRVVPAIRSGLKQGRRPFLAVLLALCMLGTVLFIQRYGVNLAHYKTPVPDCGQVLTTEQCLSYGPWGRDHYLEQSRPVDFEASPINYLGHWFWGMWYRLFFAVSGPANDYANYPPLIFPGAAAIIIGLAGLICTIWYWRQVFRSSRYLFFFAGLTLIYVVTLWIDQFGMYKQTGQPVAINGRYLIPVLPLVAALFGRGISIAIAHAPKLPALRVKVVAAYIALILFLYGGGVLTFILRSEDSWYWPSVTVEEINHTAQDILHPLIIEGSREEPNAP